MLPVFLVRLRSRESIGNPLLKIVLSLDEVLAALDVQSPHFERRRALGKSSSYEKASVL